MPRAVPQKWAAHRIVHGEIIMAPQLSAAGDPAEPFASPDALAVVRGSTPLDVAERTFQLLITTPPPLAVDGRELGYGLPARLIVLGELRALLLHPATGPAARDAAWRLLVDRARWAGSAWVVGAVGMAMPGLRGAAGRLARSTGADDVQADLLAGFVTALQTVEVDRPRICSRLVTAAHTAARAAARAEAARCGLAAGIPGPGTPAAPWGHPDFVLARAVAAGVITAGEAELIGATRLEDVSLAAYADHSGISRWAAYKQRSSAEARLVAAIRDGALTDPDTETITEATLTVAPDPAEYRRSPRR
jgi:hypothetical protein